MWRILLVLLVLAPGAARARTVAIDAQAARDGGVRTERLPLIRFSPSHHAYGLVRDPAPLLSLRASIIEDEARLRLADADLKRTQQLYHAAHNVSEASLEQAQAKQGVAAARLAADKAKASALYGSSLGDALAASAGPVAALAAGRTSLVEVSLAGPALPRPPRQALAQGKALKLIGPAGSVPSGLIGQSFYYSGPPLPSGMPLPVRLPEGAARSGYAVPLSALTYRGGKASLFVETSPGRFAMIPVPMDDSIRKDGRRRGYFVPRRAIPPGALVAVQGAGLLLSVAEHRKAKAKPAKPDKD